MVRFHLANLAVWVCRAVWFCLPSFLVYVAVVLITAVLFHAPLHLVALGLALLSLGDRLTGGRLL
jgi:hypothetical protein